MRTYAILLLLLFSQVLCAATAPEVVSINPPNNSMNVDIFTTFTVTFSAPMDQISTEAAVFLQLGSTGPSPCTPSWTNPTTLVLTPEWPLYADNGGYYLVVGATALGLDGTPIAADAVSGFYTATLLASGSPLTSPVTSLIHLGGVTDHVIGHPGSGQSLLWDHLLVSGMGPEQIQQPAPGVTIPFLFGPNQTSMAWQRLSSGSGQWFSDADASMVDYSGIYLLVPNDRPAQLAATCGGSYNAWLDGVVIATNAGTGPSPSFDLPQGAHLLLIKSIGSGTSTGLTFSLTDSSGTPFTDLREAPENCIPPTVAVTYPANTATGVGVDDDVILQFSEPMQPQDASQSIIVSGGVMPPGTWAWTDPFHLCFRPSSPLAPATTYAVEVSGDYLDLGNLWQTNPMGFTFTTQDAGAPTPTALLPASAPTGSSVVCALSAGNLRGRTTYPVGAIPFQGHRYSLQLAGLAFDAAEANCEANGGYLATIGSSQEDMFIWKMGGRVDAWIGFDDAADGETWTWVDGEPVNYTNWAPGSPSNLSASQNYAAFSGGMQWNNDSDGPRNYIIESEPQGIQGQLSAHGLPTIPLSIHVGGSTDASCSVSLADALPGTYDLTLTNLDGTTGTLANAFIVTRLGGPSVNATPSTTSVALNWSTITNGSAIVVRRPGGTNPTQPSDGVALVIGAALGAGTVVDITSLSTDLDQGLPSGTNLCYDIYQSSPGLVYSFPGTVSTTTLSAASTAGSTATGTTTAGATSSGPTATGTTSASSGTTGSGTNAGSGTGTGTSGSTSTNSTASSSGCGLGSGGFGLIGFALLGLHRDRKRRELTQ